MSRKPNIGTLQSLPADEPEVKYKAAYYMRVQSGEQVVEYGFATYQEMLDFERRRKAENG